jgi:GNAT superfamily N-acetyltransferase
MHGLLKTMINGSVKKHLDIGRIGEIASATGLPLTLHGGSGTDDDDFRRAILAGVTIIHMTLHLWGKLAEPRVTAWEVGRKRRNEGRFAYRNATVIEHEGRTVGTLICYEIADHPVPIANDMPAMFVLLQEPAAWHMVCDRPRYAAEYRNLGLGSDLLRLAEDTGRNLGKRGMSLIVSDTNIGARLLYERFGYREIARRTMIKENWSNEGREWLLLTNKFSRPYHLYFCARKLAGAICC